MSQLALAPPATEFSDDALACWSDRMQDWPAAEIVAWALATFGRRICVAASMGDTVLVHLATAVDPDVEVVFLDTGFHFAETIQTVRQAQARYQLNLRVERADQMAADVFNTGTEQCCTARKVVPLERALSRHDAWMTGLRRAEAASRADTPIVGRDRRGKVKVCPLAAWSDDEVTRYIATHDLVTNPLLDQGYPSIGCWPCTNAVAVGENPRSGRWSGSSKTECGLHR